MYKKIQGMRRYFCHKVLPLVYDDSLSYYEVLCKLTNKINEIIDLINGKWGEAILKMLYDKLNELYANVSYDESNERLKLYLDAKIFADGEHVYSESDETIEITEGGDC